MSIRVSLLSLRLLTALLGVALTLATAPTSSALSTPRWACRERADAAGPQPLAVFLGDSYTSGWAGSGFDAEGWPALAAGALRLQLLNLAHPGAGFIRPGLDDRRAIGAHIDAAIQARPAVVFLAGGLNDVNQSPARAAVAAEQVVRRLRAGLPSAALVVIGPWWPARRAPAAAILTIRDRLRTSARDAGALFLDPIADGWFEGVGRIRIGPDRQHPTNEGYRALASRILAAVRSFGPYIRAVTVADPCAPCSRSC